MTAHPPLLSLVLAGIGLGVILAGLFTHWL